MSDNDEAIAIYLLGSYLVGIAAFFGSWWYAVDRWGWFLGIGLCWLPALCVGVLAGLAWPLVLGVIGYYWLTGAGSDGIRAFIRSLH